MATIKVRTAAIGATIAPGIRGMVHACVTVPSG